MQLSVYLKNDSKRQSLCTDVLSELRFFAQIASDSGKIATRLGLVRGEPAYKVATITAA